MTVEFGDPVNLGTPSVSDLADPAPSVINYASAQFPLGVTIVTWTATDASGNLATDTQTVTVTQLLRIHAVTGFSAVGYETDKSPPSGKL